MGHLVVALRGIRTWPRNAVAGLNHLPLSKVHTAIPIFEWLIYGYYMLLYG